MEMRTIPEVYNGFWYHGGETLRLEFSPVTWVAPGVWAPTESLLMRLLLAEHCRNEDSLADAQVPPAPHQGDSRSVTRVAGGR